ncbi:hypothetical protein EG68_01168 [Paragonimus skrjabini miyazakii]|uniref:EF-hand domain-containing protein n=1 Tax=Paragonimus skrjabini miyazakii TaxID=59628 RepID=A0A8S9Z215_9TREM|nr:hypothetical protein EG68_01168 [Paragonimus skrjabini miyazakii]
MINYLLVQATKLPGGLDVQRGTDRRPNILATSYNTKQEGGYGGRSTFYLLALGKKSERYHCQTLYQKPRNRSEMVRFRMLIVVKKWFQLFDTDHTGKITLQKYCDVLGIVLDSQQICQYRIEERQLALPEKVSAPYEVLYTEMPEAMQIEIVNMAREMMDKNVAFRELPTSDFALHFKNSLDQKYGPVWQVVVIEGSYWMTHIHIEHRTFHFRIGPRTIIAWQTKTPRKQIHNTTNGCT